MAKVHVVLNTKGGVGKSVIAAHLIPSLIASDKVKIYEIDNNNKTQDFYANSAKTTIKSVSTEKKELEKALDEAGFYGAEEEIILDAGGGDDTIRVIDSLEKSGMDCIYYIPLKADADAVANALEVRKRLGSARKYLILNDFVKKEDFWFIYGNEDYKIPQDTRLLSEFDGVFEAPRSSLFGIAKIYKNTLCDIASIQKSYVYETEKEKWRAGGLEMWLAKRAVHRLSCDADEYLVEFARSCASCATTKNTKK